ncbi:hypothetical protein CJ205_00830 [Dolosicoccus paucivorans]|uniref:UPF0316 protein CJ205_00830 n=1 Tax=Dolosicoccus paucivorans TaxID=84521 RepID=A0A2N6SPP0_9LACT|nr:DUF2179 domain-containing protein [Dolosicoccus paucivorans]PMC59041.1 hypothetical protein CJ205_00830 [Dolosicoccus paucivorans]
MDVTLLIFIFVINLGYISLNTLRVLLMMRGYRKIAPVIAMIEVIIYTLGLSIVMRYIDQPIYLLTYAFGFGMGIMLGMLIEEKLALGYAVIQIIIKEQDADLADQLRELGYGVTVQEAYGREGNRIILTVLSSRKNEALLYDSLNKLAPHAFYFSFETKYINGGFWSKKIQRRMDQTSSHS